MTDPAAMLRLLLRGGLVLRLYRVFNSDEPRELKAADYQPITLQEKDWTLDGAQAGTEQTWDFKGATDEIAGWMLTDADAGLQLATQAFADGPYQLKRLGGTIRVTVTLALAAKET